MSKSRTSTSTGPAASEKPAAASSASTTSIPSATTKTFTTTTSTAVSPNPTTEKSNKDLTHLLTTLNLSTLNNRAIGISNDTQKLLESFTLILKDIINGAPTAYHDLEHLLKTREAQLDKLFGELPPFMQTLVRSVPVKMYAVLAPQLAAAIPLDKLGEKSGSTGVSVNAAEVEDVGDLSTKDKDKAGGKKEKEVKKKRAFIPTVKNLIAQKGAVAAMLRSILSFLEMRFPLFLTGTNVLMSLSVFVLLFTFYYCHKRGKEARLETQLLNAIELPDPVDPSLDMLERAITLEQSEIVQERKRHEFEKVGANVVPLMSQLDGED